MPPVSDRTAGRILVEMQQLKLQTLISRQSDRSPKLNDQGSVFDPVRHKAQAGLRCAYTYRCSLKNALLHFVKAGKRVSQEAHTHGTHT